MRRSPWVDRLAEDVLERHGLHRRTWQETVERAVLQEPRPRPPAPRHVAPVPPGGLPWPELVARELELQEAGETSVLAVFLEALVR